MDQNEDKIYKTTSNFETSLPTVPHSLPKDARSLNEMIDVARFANHPDTPAFLKAYDWNALQSDGSSTVDWTYEDRWLAQRILPFLFIGPIRAGKDTSFLKTAGITLKITIRHAQGFATTAVPASDPSGIEAHTFDIPSQQALIAAFPHICGMINAHMIMAWQRSSSNPDARVLVCCETGNERSPVVAVAYMLETLGMELPDAVHYVHAQRFSSNLENSTTILTLQTYADILKARRDTGYRSTPSSSAAVLVPANALTNPRKRSLTSEDAGDTDMAADADFNKTRAFAPFKDV